jgi:CheY-like chemotaxis protein
MEQPRVLAVEDNLETQSAIQRDLAKVGVVVVGCATAEEGWDKLEKGLAVKAIILDFMLPGEDGPTFFRKLAQDKRFRNIPVVPFSSLVSQQKLGGFTIVEDFVRSRGDMGRDDASTSMVGKGTSEAIVEVPPALFLALAHALQKTRTPLPESYRVRLREIARTLVEES